tara:strand:- start:41 stop:145 length:105 start_codon:yes stop_codon:yes gene_type:complete
MPVGAEVNLEGLSVAITSDFVNKEKYQIITGSNK